MVFGLSEGRSGTKEKTQKEVQNRPKHSRANPVEISSQEGNAPKKRKSDTKKEEIPGRPGM